MSSAGGSTLVRGLLGSKYARLEQGSDAWIALRYGDEMATTASRLASVLGVSDYTSRAACMRKTLGGGTGQCSDAMQFGIDHEDYVAQLYLDQMRKTYPRLRMFVHGFKKHAQCPAFGSSIDRLLYDPDSDTAWGLEIKTRPYGEWRQEVPLSHRVQMMGVAACYDLPFMDYVCWSPTDATLAYSRCSVEPGFFTEAMIPIIEQWHRWRQAKRTPTRMPSKLKRARIAALMSNIYVTAHPDITAEEPPPPQDQIEPAT
ncbi:MAG: YqaJ viral recombinase family protein [Limisphaerales bacterium]